MGHTNVLLQTVYIGTGCKPPMLFYPPGYTAGKSGPVVKGVPSFRPTAGVPTKPMKPTKPTVVITSVPVPLPTVQPVIKPTHNPHTHYPTV